MSAQAKTATEEWVLVVAATKMSSRWAMGVSHQQQQLLKMNGINNIYEQQDTSSKSHTTQGFELYR
jgi:hypothetical protein